MYAAAMPRPVIDEWSGERLIYLSPSQALAKFGYRGPGSRPDATDAEREYFANIDERVPLQDGEPSPVRSPYPSAAEAASAMKALAAELGAGLVGVTPVDPQYVYEGHEWAAQGNAIVIAVAMDMDEILQVPRPESNAEYIRVYDEVSRIAVDLAWHIRQRGYAARAHTLRDEHLAMLPHAYAAGLGELGKHGSLINRDFGSSFRVSIVTTELPLAPDSPRIEGIDDFCTNCQMCVNHCPGDAIDNEKQDVRGVHKWVVDTEKCAPYFATYYACAICLKVCPWNASAFGGAYKQSFIDTIKRTDPHAVTAELRAGAQQAWSLVER